MVQVFVEKLGPVEKGHGCDYNEGYVGEPNTFTPPLTQTKDEPVTVDDILVRKLYLLSDQTRVNAVLRRARKS